MNTKIEPPKSLTSEAMRRVEAAECEFHVRAFGEELARVNFLPEHERRRYVSDMIDHAAGNAVRLSDPPTGVKR